MFAFVAVGAAYTGYWFWLARVFEQQFALWVDQQRATGYRIDYSASKPSGFPFLVTIRLADVLVEAPSMLPQWQFSTSTMQLKIAPWSPLTLKIADTSTAPEYQIRWTAGGHAYNLSLDGPSLSIQLPNGRRRLGVEFGNQSIRVKQDSDWTASMFRFSGSVEIFDVKSDQESSVKFDFSAAGINFDLPDPINFFETYRWKLTGEVIGPLPTALTTNAVANWSNAGGYLALNQLEGSWELLTDVNVDGSFALDSHLQPIASMTATIRGHIEFINWLKSNGVVSQAQATSAKIALSVVAQPTDDPFFLFESRVPLTIQDGFLFLGPLKIAAVPRIDWKM